MRFKHAWITRALTKEKAFVSALRQVKKRVFKRKSSKPIIAGIALTAVGISTAVAFALAVDPGANSRIDYAMNFDGSTTYASTSTQLIPSASDYTIEAYVKEAVGTSNDNFFIAQGTTGDSTGGIGLGFSGLAGQRCLLMRTPTSQIDCNTFNQLDIPQITVPQGDWVHIGLSYASSTQTFTLYLNGNLYASRYYPASFYPLQGGFVIGRNTGSLPQYGYSYFTGQIDEVKIFNTTRTASEDALDTYTYLSPTTPGLVAQYDFNEGGTGGGFIFDRTSNNNDLTISGNATFSDIAQYSVPDRSTNRIRMSRSYLTTFGGWFPPAGVTAVSGNLYAGGGGGGGGASYETINGGGGGGGGAGNWTTFSSTTVSAAAAIPVRIGLGGPGGLGGIAYPSDTTSSPGYNGFPGQSSSFKGSSTNGGGGGWGGGYSSGTTTVTAGKGGKGGNNGGTNTGSTITTSNDGGGGAGNSSGNVAADTRTGNAGSSITAIGISGNVVVGGSGGYGAATSASATFGAHATPGQASGGGGGGGIKGAAYDTAYNGGFGSSGTLVLSYSSPAGAQEYDYLYTFNGTNQYAESMPSTTSFDVTGDLTLEAWVNPADACTSAICTIAGRDNNYLLATSNGTYRWRITTNTGASVWYDTGITLAVGQWQHVALVRSGSSVLFYLNGNLMSTQANGDADAQGAVISMTGESSVGFGWFAVAARGVDHQDLFSGGIDEVRLWKVVRTAAEIGNATTGAFNRALNAAELASANLIAYWDMNDTIITAQSFINRKTGSTSLTDLSVIGSPSAAINGYSGVAWVNRYLSLNSASSQTYIAPDSPSFESTGTNFTISAWWKVPSCNNSYLVTKGNTYMVGIDNACKINFSFDPGVEGDAQTWRWMNTGFALTANTWQYVSVIKVGTTVYTYVDGTLVSTIADGDTVAGYNSGASSVTALIPANLGNRNTYFGIGSTGTDASRANFTSQIIDDVRIWNSDRRANQTLDMAGFVPFNQAGLAVQYNFDTLVSNPDLVPNRAVGADADSHLISSGASMSTASTTGSPPPSQPKRSQTLIQRSVIKSSTMSGLLIVGTTSLEYWMAGGGGGGGAGGNSGYSGGGGGAGALVTGVATGTPNGIGSDLLVVQKIGAGGTFAVNNGDSVATVATNGGTSSFSTTGLNAAAVGGGAGGSGTTNPAGAPQGSNGASGGGSGSTGGAGGTGSAGSAGGSGSSNAAGGGGGFVSAGANASPAGAGGAGGKGYLVPALNPVWAVGGGTGHGSVSAVNTNAARGATAATATGVFGSGGGGNGFASAGVGSVRGGAGGAGFLQIDGFVTQPFVEQGSTSVMSGATFKVPLKVSLRDINGNVLTSLTDSIAVSTSTAGCGVVTNSGSYKAVAGQITMHGLAVTATTNKTCVLSVSDTTSGGAVTYSVSVMTTPASITISSSATTAGCSFSNGWFTCPNNTNATLNVTDLNNELNARDVALAATTSSSTSGGITVNSGLTIGGSVGELSITASGYLSNLIQAGTGNITLGSGIALTGPGKALIVKATGYIYTNTAATSGARTTFSTNGGDMYFGSSTVGSYDSPIKFASYNSFNTNGGNFTATGGLDPTTGHAQGGRFTQNRGLNFMTGASISTGAGNVVLRGRLNGNDSANATPYDSGLVMEQGSQILTTSGSVSLNGYTGGFTVDQGTSRQAIKVASATISTDSGDITLDGTSAQDKSNNTSNYWLTGATITSNSGAIRFTGFMFSTSNAGAALFSSPQSTIGSGTGNVTLTTSITSANGNNNLDHLKLTGGGTHSILLPNPSIGASTATSFQLQGTGDLVIGHNAAAAAWFANLNIPANADFGTGYKTITIGDSIADSTSKGIALNTTLTASDRVSLNGQSISGTGAVVAPNLSISQTGTASQTSILTGSSSVSTLALKRLTAPSNCTISSVGINDANGWAPGTVNGVVGQFGLPSKLGMVQQPAVTSTSPRNAPLATQPIVQVQDVWGCAPTDVSGLAGYTITATPTGSTMTGLPSQVSGADGKVTFTNATPLQATATTIAFTASPALTSVTSNSFTPAASSTVVSSAVVTAGSTAATSGVFFPVQPKVTYYDAYGNVAVSASSFLTNAALTSYPVGASTASLVSGFGMSNTPVPSGSPAVGTAISTGSNFKITGPTGNYTITFTSFGGVTSTLTVAVTGWTLDYGATTVNYKLGTYPANFQGNGTGAVTYATSTGAICSVNSSTGEMTPLRSGTCTVTASQAADGTYPAGSTSATVTIVAATQSTVNVRAASSTLVYGSSVALTSDGGDGTGGYVILVKTGNCVTSGNSLLVGSAHSGDTCEVWAYRAATTNKWLQTYSAPITITVTQASQTALNSAPTGKQAGYGNAYDLAAATSGWSWGGNGTGAIIFTSSTAGCSISGSVLTSTAAIGSNCVINVQRAASTDYLISGSVTMNVLMVKGAQTVSYVTVAYSVRVSDQVTLSATSSSGLTVSYALGAGSSAYCSLSGATVTFTAAGTCVINANQSGDSNYNAATASPINYTVDKGLQTITFGTLADDYVSVTTQTLTATASSGLSVAYSVGGNTTNSACSVTSSGVLTLSATGVCEIIADQSGSVNFEAATPVSQSFNVNKGIQSALVITSPNTATYGQTISLTATGGNGTGAYDWVVNSGPCSIASGTSTLVLGDAGTSCVIKLERAGDANWQSAGGQLQTVSVTKATQSTLNITNPNTVVYGNQLALTSGGGSGTGALTWSTVAPCSVSGTNLTVGDAGVGCVVTLVKAADDNYLAATVTMNISVTRANQSAVTFTSASNVAYGQTLTLAATGGSGDGAFSYAATGTCSVAGNVLTVGAVGSSCSVTATRAQSTNYLAETSAAVTITIDKANQTIGTISVTGTPRALGSVALSAISGSGLTVTFSIDSSSTAFCSITAAIVSFTKAGDCVVNANQSGDSNYNAAPQLQSTITAAAATQTISLTNPGGKRYLDASFAISGAASSSLNLVYTLGANTDGFGQSSAACSVSSSGTVTILEVGSCEILANQAGNDVYSAAPEASVTFAIAKALQPALAITSATSATYGSTIALTYSGGAGAGAVTYEVGAGSTCSVNQQTSTLTLGDVGDGCLVRVKQAADAHYEAAASGLASFQVTQASQTINFSSSPNSPQALGSYTVAATATSGESVAFTIDANTSSVCSISGNVVSFATSGICTILADQSGNNNYAAATQVPQTFSVARTGQTVTTVTPTNVRFGDQPFNIQSSSTSGLAVAFTLSNGSGSGVCTVTSAGEITVLNVGHCEVHTNQAGDNIYAAVPQATVAFEIAKGPQASLSISSNTPVTYGQTMSLQTSGGSGTGSISYATNGTCSVSGSTLTVGNAGSLCEVKATKAADTQYEAEESSWVTITINKANQTPLLISSSSTVAYGNTITLAVSGGSGPTSLTYATTGTCSVASGVLTVGDAGSTCTVTATNAASTNYQAATSPTQTITITKANQTISITSSASSAVALGTYTVVATAQSGDNVVISISPASTSVCSVSGTTVSFLAGGTCVINANEDGNDNYNAAPQAQETVTVAKAAQSISFTSAGVKRFGDASFAAQATATSGLAVTYSLGGNTTNSSCSVASDGTVTITNVGDCEVIGSQAGNSIYAAATDASQVISIGKGTQATLTMSSVDTVAYGTTLTLAASGGSGAGTVTFTATGDCTISSGVLSVGIVGSTCSVTATKSGDSQYDPISSAAQAITVIRGTQATLTITAAATQTYGTTQVLTTSGGSGSGVVSYSTGSGCSVFGDVLSVGGGGSTCQIRAHKAASANYDAAVSAFFFVTVDKANQAITSHTSAVQPRALDNYTPSGDADSGLPVYFDVDPSTSAVCQKGATFIHFAIAGTCLVNFTQPGNANYNAATTVQETITVAKRTQTISTVGPQVIYFGAADFQLSQTASSGLPVTYSLNNGTTNGSCTVSSSGVVHVVTTGNCYWQASQAGDDRYEAASPVISYITIDRAQQAAVTITPSATTAEAFSTITVSASGGSGTGTYSYHTYGTCSISGTTVTLGAVGTLCEVWAIKARDDNYAAEPSSASTITITRATQATLTMSSASSVAYGGTITLATSGGSGDGAVTYATTGTCSVNNGVLTVGDAGSACTVTATKAQSANYLVASSAAQTITINKANQTVAFTSSSTGWEALDTYTPTFSSSAGLSVDVTIDPATSSVCTASNGVVTFLIAGTCTIRANQAGNSNYNPITQLTQSDTVIKVGQVITVTPVSRHYVGDASFNISATSTSPNLLTYSLGSNTTNSSCSVNSSTGLVMILATGTCEVNVDQNGDAAYLPAQTATVSFPIGKGTQAPLVITNLGTVTYGDVVNLLTSGGSVNGAAVTYSTTGTCSVNGAQLTFGNAGSLCTVTAFLDGNDQYLPVTSATVTATIQKADQAAFGLSNTAPPVYGQPYVLTTMGGSGDGAVTYEVTAPCTVSGDVVTLGDANINCYVTPRKAASLNYNAVSDFQRVLYISRASQAISITSTPSSSVALDTYNVVATATSGASVSVSIASASNTVCSVSGTTVTFLTAGDCVIYADQAGNTNYTAATRAQQTITVTKKAQTITFPQVATQQFGAAAVSLTATAQSTLQVTYAVDSATTNNSCSVDNNNQTVSLLGAGDCYLTANQAGNDIWSASAQATMQFTITRGVQATVSMTSGTSVVYGNTLALTAAGGSGAGSITYATTGTCTVSGSTLTVGDAGSSCSVTATKAQDTNYLAKTSAAQTITITRATQATLVLSSIASVTYGQNLTLSTTGGSGDGAVTYTASGSCTVSGNTLTGGAAGSNCVVYATKAQSTNYNSIDSASRTQSVAKAAQTISVTSTPTNATALGTYTVVATATSGLTPSVAVSTATAANCSVSGFVVTFNNALNCDLEVTQAGNTNFDPATMVPQSITPQLATDTITIPAMANRTVLSTDLTASATSVSGLQLTYSSVAPGNGIFNCSVTSNGTLTLIQPGVCWIRASHAGNTVYAAATALNSFNITRAEQTALNITSSNTVPFLDTIALTASGGSGTGAISFTANGACSITNGILSLGEVGSACSVTATRAGDATYNATTSASQAITVTQIAQEPIVVMSAASVRFGQTLPLVSVGGSGSGAETWSIDTGARGNSANCAIDSGALTLSGATSGACDIVVSKAASRNYVSAVSPRFTVTVNKAIQTISFSSTIPSEPVAGDTYTVAATTNSGLAPVFSIASASTAYCSISGALVSFIATGDCVIEANQTGDGRYLAAPTKLQTIAVGAKNQTIDASAVVDRRFGDAAFVITATTQSTSPVTFAVGPNTTASACSVNSSGVVQILAVGHCEIVLSAVADSQYAAASDITRAFNVVADQAGAPFITSMSANNQEVTVSFLPPTYTGGVALRGFGINAYVNGTLAVTTSSCDVNSNTCTIEGLTNGTDYTISMFAINVAGDGALSAANGPIRPATRAAAVQRLVAVGVNTALDISWAAPASLGGGTFDSYRIYVRPRGGTYPSTPTEQIFTAGQTSTQITGLINGQSYDVKVVTITSANTLQLVSNTAEVVQYPKTIPDAPQAVTLAPISTSGLLISWMDPASDGGDAIQSYQATVVGGQTCTVTPGANLCEVSGLVSGTTYRVEVVAANGAGTSPASSAVITFRAATVTAPPVVVVNGGGGSSAGDGSGFGDSRIWVAFERKATAKLNGTKQGQWISRENGGRAIFSGTRLMTVKKILVDEKTPVKIISQTDTELVLQMPPGTKSGVADVWFYATAHTVRYMHAIEYVSELKPIVKTIKGFKQLPKALTTSQKAQIKKILPTVKAYKHVTCAGTTKDAWLTCKQIKTLRPSIFVRVVKLKPNTHTKAGQQAYKTVKLTFTK